MENRSASVPAKMSDPSAAQLRRDILGSFELLLQHVSRWRQVDLLDIDTTMPQARCLMYVAIEPATSISGLAAHLHIGLPAASGLVERLVEAGHLQRNADPHDRRQQLVTLTEQGRTLVDRFHELPVEKLSELIAGLSPQELRGLRTGVLAIEREARRIADQTTEIPADREPERTPA